MTATSAATQTRPAPPRRAITMLVPLLVAGAAMVFGAATAEVAYGAFWGLIAALGILAALHLGKVAVDGLDRLLIVLGVTASTAIAVRILPAAPETLDVLTAISFAAAWIPAGLALAVVAGRRKVGSSGVVNTALAWILTGAFALPAAQTFGLLQPLDTLRRGVESDFGIAVYMVIAFVMAGVAIATFLAIAASLPNFATVSTLVIFTLFAGASVGFSIGAVFEGIANIVNVPNLWPPDFAWAIGETGRWWWIPSWEFGAPLRANPIIETIRIGITATVLGCAIALPLAFLASTLTAPRRGMYLAAKGFMNVTRTIPDLFWAVILVASVGTGPFAGAAALTVFAMAIMAKLFSETIDGADPGPLEAAKSTGSRHSPAVKSSVLPQVLPNYVAYCLYIFELTIRASIIVGLVGAGGIGRVIEAQRAFYRFDRILAILVVIIAIVFVLEQISVALRRRLV